MLLSLPDSHAFGYGDAPCPPTVSRRRVSRRCSVTKHNLDQGLPFTMSSQSSTAFKEDLLNKLATKTAPTIKAPGSTPTSNCQSLTGYNLANAKNANTKATITTNTKISRSKSPVLESSRNGAAPDSPTSTAVNVQVALRSRRAKLSTSTRHHSLPSITSRSLSPVPISRRASSTVVSTRKITPQEDPFATPSEDRLRRRCSVTRYSLQLAKMAPKEPRRRSISPKGSRRRSITPKGSRRPSSSSIRSNDNESLPMTVEEPADTIDSAVHTRMLANDVIRSYNAGDLLVGWENAVVSAQPVIAEEEGNEEGNDTGKREFPKANLRRTRSLEQPKVSKRGSRSYLSVIFKSTRSMIEQLESEIKC